MTVENLSKCSDVPGCIVIGTLLVRMVSGDWCISIWFVREVAVGCKLRENECLRFSVEQLAF